MKLLIKIIFLAMLSFLFSDYCIAQTAEDHFKRGDGFLDRKLVPDAIVELKKALPLLKEDQDQLKAEIYVSLANAYNWKGTHKAAITACNKALEINPNIANAHYNLGFAYREEGDSELSEKEFGLFDKLLKQEGEYVEITEKSTSRNIQKFIALGDNYFATGKFNEAIAEYNKALDIKPHNDIFNKLEQVYQQKRLVGKSEDTSPTTDNLTSRKTLGNIHGLTESDKIAQKTLIEKILGRGVSHYDEGMIAKAIDAFKEVLEIDPENSKAHYSLGNAYADTGEVDKAIAMYKKAIENDPELVDAYLYLSMLYLDMDLIEESISLCNQAVTANPNDALLSFHLGESYALDLQYKEAITAYNKAISLNPMDPETQYRLAESYYETEQFDMALKHAIQAEKLGYITEPEFMSDLKKKTGTE